MTQSNPRESLDKPREVEASAAQEIERLLDSWTDRGRQWTTRSYYPIFLDLAGRKALVVGAGAVAEGKIEGLLAAGAEVSVVALAAGQKIAGWAAEGRIRLHVKPYEAADLDDCVLVVAATENNDTNVAVFDDASGRGVLCNVVDVPKLCSFIVPSVHRTGDLAVAVSTGGSSPAFAGRIRVEMEELFDERYAFALRILGALREELKERCASPAARRIVLERIVYSDLLDWIADGDVERIESWVQMCIEEGVDRR